MVLSVLPRKQSRLGSMTESFKAFTGLSSEQSQTKSDEQSTKESQSSRPISLTIALTEIYKPKPINSKVPSNKVLQLLQPDSEDAEDSEVFSCDSPSRKHMLATATSFSTASTCTGSGEPCSSPKSYCDVDIVTTSPTESAVKKGKGFRDSMKLGKYVLDNVFRFSRHDSKADVTESQEKSTSCTQHGSIASMDRLIEVKTQILSLLEDEQGRRAFSMFVMSRLAEHDYSASINPIRALEAEPDDFTAAGMAILERHLQGTGKGVKTSTRSEILRTLRPPTETAIIRHLQKSIGMQEELIQLAVMQCMHQFILDSSEYRAYLKANKRKSVSRLSRSSSIASADCDVYDQPVDDEDLVRIIDDADPVTTELANFHRQSTAASIADLHRLKTQRAARSGLSAKNAQLRVSRRDGVIKALPDLGEPYQFVAAAGRSLSAVYSEDSHISFAHKAAACFESGSLDNRLTNASWWQTLIRSCVALPFSIFIASTDPFNNVPYPLVFLNPVGEERAGHRSHVLGTCALGLFADGKHGPSPAEMERLFKEGNPADVYLETGPKAARTHTLLALKPLLNQNGRRVYIIGFQLHIPFGVAQADWMSLVLWRRALSLLPDTIIADVVVA